MSSARSLQPSRPPLTDKQNELTAALTQLDEKESLLNDQSLTLEEQEKIILAAQTALSQKEEELNAANQELTNKQQELPTPPSCWVSSRTRSTPSSKSSTTWWACARRSCGT